jgi:hypothetical protein
MRIREAAWVRWCPAPLIWQVEDRLLLLAAAQVDRLLRPKRVES